MQGSQQPHLVRCLETALHSRLQARPLGEAHTEHYLSPSPWGNDQNNWPDLPELPEKRPHSWLLALSQLTRKQSGLSQPGLALPLPLAQMWLCLSDPREKGVLSSRNQRLCDWDEQTWTQPPHELADGGPPVPSQPRWHRRPKHIPVIATVNRETQSPFQHSILGSELAHKVKPPCHPSISG